ncbi:MAG: hypothetical protein LBM59_03270 [Ruminococcus sp.]|jgi:4-diphosphocytidyl-2-C-methyl-D-erythritol kinase|nr:hypothetical protein [Ruminococcus sp.]
MKITAIAPAKINLTLTVGKRLQSGYHDINTIMQTVSLTDIITLENTGQNGISVTVTGQFSEGVPTDDSNICVKAARLFLQDGLHIHIEKNIPHGAGLGGGSSDAAAVIVGLASIKGKIDTGQLELAAMNLGADVPFFIRGGLRLCTGIGMDLSDTDYDWGVNSPRIVIAMGSERMSTSAAYEILDKAGAADFDSVITNPEITEIKRLMRDAGAYKVSLSGSGAAVYGIFPGSEIKSIQKLKNNIRKDGYFCEICEPVAYGGKVTWAQI